MAFSERREKPFNYRHIGISANSAAVWASSCVCTNGWIPAVLKKKPSHSFEYGFDG